MRVIIIFSLMFGLIVNLNAQNRHTISGYVKDIISGETLIGVNIYDQSNPGTGTITNEYGFYSLTLPEGNFVINFSYIGYDKLIKEISLKSDLRLNVDLNQGIQINEVLITAKQEDKNVQSTEMSTISLPVENIKKLPSLFGEVDILKSLQLLPGVQFGGEGNAGFYVRGGGADQNLILLDEANVYNSGHMLGFFSVFNSDAIKNTTLYKGGMPASYGGRLSSVVDIQMKDGNNKNYAAEGGIGLISSRFMVEGPIINEKASFLLAGRRTYLFDVIQPLLNTTNYAGTNYYFYDFNTKVNYKFSDKDRLYISGYFGRDILKFISTQRDFRFRVPYGNTTATVRWNHLFSDKLFMNLSGIYNVYDFSFGGGQGDFQVDVASGVRDYNIKLDFDYFPNYKNQIGFGILGIHHRLSPNIAHATNGEISFVSPLKPKYGLEYAAYIQDDVKWSSKLSMNIGLRATAFSQIGPYLSSIDSMVYQNWDIVKTYYSIEPRLSVKYTLTNESSIKASINPTTQYLHLVSNSSSTLPTDVWVPSSELVKPQRGIQYAAGYFRNFLSNEYEASVELYYKNMYDQIDYGESYVNAPAEEVEKSFVYGEGKSYGAELFLRKSQGKLNGWIAYTLSKTFRNFKEINNGVKFPVTYDRTHDLNIVVNYQLSKKWECGGIFVYTTGNTYTPLKSLFFIEQDLNIEYGTRNSERIAPYHRLDISFTYTPHPESTRRFTSSWNFSIYNVYNRLNPSFIYNDIKSNIETGEASVKAIKVSLFPIIPSVTWNFKWK